MTKQELKIMVEQFYRFVGITSNKKKSQIIKLLMYCKEIRDTAYPMKDSLVTELKIVEFTAHKDKDMININGSLSLSDGDIDENRCFEAYIMETEKENEYKVYMDITRVCAKDEPKLIRTSELISIGEINTLTVTRYYQTDGTEEKTFSCELPTQNEKDATILLANLKQLHI